MKTTIDIPEDLYKAAKIRAVEQGTTLKELMLTALRRELAPATQVREEQVPYFARRVLLPEFKALMDSGALKGGRDSTDTISEDRDAH